MLVYEKKVEDKRELFGTLGNVPSEDDEQLTYKDAQGDEIEIVEGDKYFDDTHGGIVRESDGKEVAVFIGEVCIIPKGFEPKPDEVVSIEITAAPTKTSYIEGQELDLDGIKVEATMKDGDVKVVTGFTSEPAEGTALTLEDTKVTITYGGQTAEQAIEVEERVAEDLAWSVAPTKIDYKVGEELNLAGTSILAVFNDGSEEDVTADCTFDPEDGATITEEMDKIVATYGELTAEQLITVMKAEDNAYTAAGSVAEVYKETYYNKYDTPQIVPAEDDYYVKVINGNLGDVSTVTINDRAFAADETFKLSIGKGSFLQGNFFKAEEDGIYIAFPIVLFELADNGTVVVNGETFEFDGGASTELAVLSSRSEDTSVITIEGANTEFTVVQAADKHATKWIAFELDGVSATDGADTLITKKLDRIGETTLFGYGFCASDGSAVTAGTYGGVAYYPLGWYDHDASEIGYTERFTEYTIYSIGVGKTATLNISITIE